jgi:two-component system nitrate/nitrite response regulator NarL
VYIADDHPLFLEAMAGVIRERHDLELVGLAATGDDAASDVAALAPDVAVLDIRLPGRSGLAVLEQAAGRPSKTRFLILSAHVESNVVLGALARGAAGYVSKESDRDAICDAIVAAAKGQTVLSPDVRRSLAGALRARTAPAAPVLTPRERAVLALAAEGRSTPEIAAHLRVASTTVKTHLQSVYAKFGVPDRTSAVATAMRRGLLE